MGGIHGSGVLSSAGDVLEMSVVSGVGDVCDGSHRSGKSQGEKLFLKVKEKSVDFELGQ